MEKLTTANQNNQLTDVYILGQLGKAIYRREGQCFVYSLEDREEVPCEEKEIVLWLDAISEYSVISQMKQSDLPELLKESANAYDALSFTLNGLDADLEELRPRAIQMANKLCGKSEKVHTFVQNRLLGYPFPQGADLDGAITFAQGCEKILNLYGQVKENLDTLQVFHNVWQTVANEFFPHQETEQARILRFLVNKGVIRDWVTTTNWGNFKQLWQTPPTDEERLLEKLNLPDEKLPKLFASLKEEFARRSPRWITVFLAEVTDDLEDRRDQIKDFLEAQNIRVIPETTLIKWDENINIKQEVEKALSQSDLFVQLLSEKAGKGYPQLQYECAKQANLRILQWCDETSNLQAVSKVNVWALVDAVLKTKIADFQQRITVQLKEIQAILLNTRDAIKVSISTITPESEAAHSLMEQFKQEGDIVCTLSLPSTQGENCDLDILSFDKETDENSFSRLIAQRRKNYGERPQPSQQIVVNMDPVRTPLIPAGMQLLDCQNNQCAKYIANYARTIHREPRKAA